VKMIDLSDPFVVNVIDLPDSFHVKMVNSCLSKGLFWAHSLVSHANIYSFGFMTFH
jgi:hypothetical protein